MNKKVETIDDLNELWDYLIECGIATTGEICLVTSINGTNLDTLESILYSRTGYRSLEQIKDCI
tara:strand:- start:601 stop:792 length:192 start_codon:yes stop_codon:yes gene_type:complete